MNVNGQLEEDKEEVVETALLSEAALAEDWLKSEEEEAWAYLVFP